MRQKDGDPMANALTTAIDKLTPAINTWAERQGGPGGGPGAAGHGQGITKEPERQTVKCVNPECDAIFDVTTARPGETTTCPKCGEEQELTEDQPVAMSRDAGFTDLRSLVGGNATVALAPEPFDLPDGTHICKDFPPGYIQLLAA
ncbi:unnamed protein product, partial [marine sediment metagenome]